MEQANALSYLNRTYYTADHTTVKKIKLFSALGFGLGFKVMVWLVLFLMVNLTFRYTRNHVFQKIVLKYLVWLLCGCKHGVLKLGHVIDLGAHVFHLEMTLLAISGCQLFDSVLMN